MHWNALEAPCPMNFQIFQIIYYYYVLLFIIDLFFFYFFPFLIFSQMIFQIFWPVFFDTCTWTPVVALETPIQPNGLTKVSCDRRHLLLFPPGCRNPISAEDREAPKSPTKNMVSLSFKVRLLMIFFLQCVDFSFLSTKLRKYPSIHPTPSCPDSPCPRCTGEDSGRLVVAWQHRSRGNAASRGLPEGCLAQTFSIQSF